MNRPVVFLLIGLFLGATLVYPDVTTAGWTVKPSAEVPLRRGMGSEYKIIAVLTDGTPVTILEEKEGWARVSLDNGKQGWILKRYLSDQPPLAEQVARLQEEKAQLEEQLAQTRQQVQALTMANGQSGRELTDCLAERDEIRASYAKLQRDTADVVKTKQELAQARTRIAADKKKISELGIENAALKKNSAMMWFLAGSGVLLLGWLIGLVSCRSKKRRNSLL